MGEDVQFQEEQIARPAMRDSTPYMVRILIKYSGGSIKTRKQAEQILLWVVIGAVIISLFLIFGVSGSNPSAPVPDPVDPSGLF